MRGTKLISPLDDSVRPTKDMVREALFNIVGPSIAGARLLDLYGGSGAVGLEALSRGAAAVTVVEIKHIDLIQKNSTKCKVRTGDEYKVIRGDALTALNELNNRGESFDIIYADPPWKDGLGERVLERAGELLNEGGWFILEAFHKTSPPENTATLRLADSRRYGDTSLHFYRR